MTAAQGTRHILQLIVKIIIRNTPVTPEKASDAAEAEGVPALKDDHPQLDRFLQADATLIDVDELRDR